MERLHTTATKIHTASLRSSEGEKGQTNKKRGISLGLAEKKGVRRRLSGGIVYSPSLLTRSKPTG